ncbi:MAG TPA: lysylphosphatidylglycerol synthase transmembrane domain-containing protein, partial [Planctomycetota bacterium]|nr:lysylphosphatidylglycerol synthase transmembrane domain-containing protein [Planctomycetota bacterium]
MTNPEPVPPRRKNHFVLILKILISAVLMTWLFYQLSHPGSEGAGNPAGNQAITPVMAIEPLWKYWPYSLAAAGLLMLSPLWTGLRWHLLLRAEGFAFHWWDSLHLTSVGYLFDAVSIGATGGDAVKGYGVYKRVPAGRRTDAVMTVLVDRVIGLISMAIMSMAGCTWLVLAGELQFRQIGALMSLLTIALLAGFMIPFMRTFDFIPRWLERRGKLGAFPVRVYKALGHYRQHRMEILVSFFFSLLNQAGLVGAAWLIFRAYAAAFANYADPVSWAHSGPEGALAGVELWALLPTGFLASMVGLFGGFGPGEFGLAAAFNISYSGPHAFQIGTMLMLGFH